MKKLNLKKKKFIGIRLMWWSVSPINSIPFGVRSKPQVSLQELLPGPQVSFEQLQRVEDAADRALHIEKFKNCLLDINNLSLEINHRKHIQKLVTDIGGSATNPAPANVAEQIQVRSVIELPEVVESQIYTTINTIAKAADVSCSKISIVIECNERFLTRKAEVYLDILLNTENYKRLIHDALTFENIDVGGTADTLGQYLRPNDLEFVVQLYRMAESGNELVVCLTTDYSLLLVLGFKVFITCYPTLHLDGNFILVLRTCATNLHYQRSGFTRLPQGFFSMKNIVFGWTSAAQNVIGGFRGANLFSLVPSITFQSYMALLGNVKLGLPMLIGIFEQLLVLANNLKGIVDIIKK
jgi:predicted nucleic-acid-binding protein